MQQKCKRNCNKNTILNFQGTAKSVVSVASSTSSTSAEEKTTNQNIPKNNPQEIIKNDEIVVRGLSIIDGQFVKLIDNGGKGDLLVKETAPVGTKIARYVLFSRIF